MTAAPLIRTEVVHALPGRVRVHLSDWEGQGEIALEASIRRIAGVVRARANTLTRNVLILFDPAVTAIDILLAQLDHVVTDELASESITTLPPALHERRGNVSRVRIAVRGLDRDPEVLRRVVDYLSAHDGVTRVAASALTGRVLVEFSRRDPSLEDLLAEVARIELPPTAGEDRPDHPLERGPLLQSGTRAAAASLGLGLLAAQRFTGFREPPGLVSGATHFAAVTGIVQSFPFIRSSLSHLFGPDFGDLALAMPSIVALTVAGSPLGLALTAAESFRLFTEVVPRRAAWRRYEAQLESAAQAHPGSVIRIESGDRVPLPCLVLEGVGTAVGVHALSGPVVPGQTLGAGARLFGGPFVLELTAGASFEPQPRPAPPAPTLYSRYLRWLNPLALGYAALTAILTRSPSRTFQAFLLVNARTAMIGTEAADTGASARVLRSGVVVVGSRQDRPIRLPNTILLDSPRLLVDGLEVTGALSLDAGYDDAAILDYAGAVAAAAGAPWGTTLAHLSSESGSQGTFDGQTAKATIGDETLCLALLSTWKGRSSAQRLRFRGEQVLVLHRGSDGTELGLIGLRPRLAAGVDELVASCRQREIELILLHPGHFGARPRRPSRSEEEAVHMMGQRTGIATLRGHAVDVVRDRQLDGSLVLFASDRADAGPAFDACDLAVGLTTGRGSNFPARADLLAPDLHALAAIVDAGGRRDTAVRDAVVLSFGANIFGAVWGLRSSVGVARASYAVYVTALSALTDGWLRLRGGERSWSSLIRHIDPRPERWGRRDVAEVFRALNTTAGGLTAKEALRRRQNNSPEERGNGTYHAILDQIRSPLNAVLAAGATLSVILGSVTDLVMIVATMTANVLVGTWQERQAGQAVAALQRIGAQTARVLRDGRSVSISIGEIVPGDVILLASGDRIAADARLIQAQGLEVDESSLTGESLSVPKSPDGPTDASRVILAGTDVAVGSGAAVVFAVGRRTRMGATAAALALDETRSSPLGIRLNRMLRQILPVAAAGGLVVFLSGAARRMALLPQLAVAASIAIAAVPEGLPLLAGVGEAAVARRLADRRALVRRLSAVEALGRVDVACTDKTGTLTEGKPSLHTVASLEDETVPSTELSPPLRQVLVAAALASPHPEASDAGAHPTDVAIRYGARDSGIHAEQLQQREMELPFDPARGFHVSLVGGRVYVKGAVEVLIPRCDSVLRGDTSQRLDESGRQQLAKRAEELGARGLRVLMVAEGGPTDELDDPRQLVALGFVGISDPIRTGVPDAVRRCRDAGVRVMMLTGDHSTTARAIATEAGICSSADEIITGPEISELRDDDLDRLMERATVIARVTPLDKMRIIQSLQRRGHTVAMTGDGVNDAPALRLADVGVAMGLHGTEVARQAADVVLADDNFAALVEALVEGRSFWRNIRRALGLLLGGNLGELGLVVGATVLGFASPLLTRQILAVNLVTDILPSLAVALQPPESRQLTRLAREGTAALDAPLRRDIWRRGLATAVPTLAAFILSQRRGGLDQARSVAFAGIVTTQLAQTLDNGRSEGSLTRAVFGAVTASAGVLLLALTTPPLQGFLSLAAPTAMGWLLIIAASLAAVLLGRGLGAASWSLVPVWATRSPVTALT